MLCWVGLAERRERDAVMCGESDGVRRRDGILMELVRFGSVRFG